MPRRLRVFVSSTMKDLRNERAEVVRRLQQFNFEPVNAEGWLPDGSDAWSRIEDEIESCDIFVLLLGDTYGWTPTEGPKSDESLSVTELEYNHAAGKGLPILPFFKRLGDDADRTSGDATKRDKFRESVAKWSGGRVRAHFDLASDLADSVGNAIVELISNSYLRQAIVQRAPGVARGVARTASPRPTPVRRDPPPPELIDAVKAKRIALFAGAGISMSAGFPSGSAFVERLQHDLSQADPTYSAISPASRFAGVASDFELYFGREKLVLAVAQLMELPQGTAPTPAHRLAVQLFDKIVTTNYDDLFEQAAADAKTGHTVITHEDEATVYFEGGPAKVILKLHGSIAAPSSIVLTEEDVFGLDERRRDTLRLAESFLSRGALMLGSSYRDPSVVALFDRMKRTPDHWFVAHTVQEVTRRRLAAKGVRWIESDADSLLEALTTM